MMRHTTATSILILVLCVVVLIPALRAVAQSAGAAQTTQSSPTSTERTSTGGKVVVGCVEREGNSFVLKADEGTYPLDTDRDLTPFIGKRIKLAGVWKATGTTTMAPMNASKSAPAEPSSEQSSSPQAFVGDLHLHITGEVVGDCATQK